MIKGLAFDLDGTLVETKDLHYEALNIALQQLSPRHVISRDDHLTVFDGLSTKEKLKMLTNISNLDITLHQQIYDLKQQKTEELLCNTMFEYNHLELFRYLKSKQYKTAICSNAIRNTVRIVIERLGLTPYVDVVLSNQDISKPKPAPDIYLKCLEMFGIKNDEMLIFEDNQNGINSGIQANVTVCAVRDPSVLTIKYIQNTIDILDSAEQVNKNII